jgi:hypothetical protein
MKNLFSFIQNFRRHNTLLLSAALGMSLHIAQGQSTSSMAVQDFDNGPREYGYTLTGNATIVSGTSRSNERPANSNQFVSGPNGLAVENNSATLTFAPQAFTGFTGNYLRFRLAAFATSPNNAGVNQGDYVRVDISPDQGATFYRTLEIRGSSDPASPNAYWGFNLARAATSYDGDGQPSYFFPGGGGLRTVDGYSDVEIDLSTTALRNVTVRIVIVSSGNNRWVIDDVVLSTAIATPLPVELKSFTAEAGAKGTQLNWSTASEKNNAAFEIQRSSTPNEFKTIGRVAGQGTSSQSHNYGWLDAQPLAGLSYYRLRQLDTDGTESFSPVATVQHKEGLVAGAFFPNPTTGQVTLNATLGAVKYRVLNTLGQTVLTGEAQGGNTVDMQSLRTGAYFLELQSANGRTVQRFMREL